MQVKIGAPFEIRFLAASPNQPFWAVAVLAHRAGPDGCQLRQTALGLHADDIEQATGVGRAFLEGRFPTADCWEHCIAVTEVRPI